MVGQYQELRVSGRFDPVGLAARLAEAELFDNYLVYERGGVWWFAGDALVEISADRDELSCRTGDRVSVAPLSDRPLRQVGDLLAGLDMPGWNVFGWAGFELSYVGSRRLRLPRQQRLLHLVVPRTEIRMTSTEIVLRGVDADRLTVVQDLLLEPILAEDQRPHPLDVRVDQDRYQDMVRDAVAEIHRGELRKVILSRTVDIGFDVDLPATYVLGRRHNTPARSFLFDLGGWEAAGFSPETVAEVTATGEVFTQALAGTRARGTDVRSTMDLRHELESDPKEVYEHAASVKLACDELATVCADGSVAVTDFMTVKERGSVQHLGSRVTGTLADHSSAFTAFEALFPAVTASGIPKLGAFDQITRLEDRPRDLYAGAVLMATHDGELDAALVLRAIFRRDGRTWLRAGAGIVADSRPEREYEETCEKLGSVAPHVVAVAHDRDLTSTAAH